MFPCHQCVYLSIQEKMLNITIHQGNVNEKHMRYVLTFIRMVIIKKQKMSFDEDVEKWNTCTPLIEMYNDVGCMEHSVGITSELPDTSECS